MSDVALVRVGSDLRPIRPESGVVPIFSFVVSDFCPIWLASDMGPIWAVSNLVRLVPSPATFLLADID